MFRFERAEEGDGIAILTLYGALDAVTAGELKSEVVKLTERDTVKVVVDLSQLTLIDSTGVGVLISLFKRLRARDGHVYFAGLTGQPKEIFRLLRLDRSLDLFPTVNEAGERIAAA